MKTHQISAAELRLLQAQDPELELIDVRTPAEFAELHVAFARNLPLDRLNPSDWIGRGAQPPVASSANSAPAAKSIYVICKSGKRGQMACEKFLAAGHPAVANVIGGTEACLQAGLPMVRGQKTIDLERQVRIVAGLFVVTSVLLGWLVSPWFYALAGLVGAGLVFAGVTNTCMLGMLLAKMPWNQRATPPTGSSACCPH